MLKFLIKNIPVTPKTILLSLLVAPLPLLLCSMLFIIIANEEFSLYSIFVIFTGHTLAYLVYCILFLPFIYLISLALKYLKQLHFISIAMGTFIFIKLFMLLLYWGHTGEWSALWWQFDSISFITSCLLAIWYWFLLQKLKQKSALTV